MHALTFLLYSIYGQATGRFGIVDITNCETLYPGWWEFEPCVTIKLWKMFRRHSNECIY